MRYGITPIDLLRRDGKIDRVEACKDLDLKLGEVEGE